MMAKRTGFERESLCCTLTWTAHLLVSCELSSTKARFSSGQVLFWPRDTEKYIIPMEPSCLDAQNQNLAWESEGSEERKRRTTSVENNRVYESICMADIESAILSYPGLCHTLCARR